MSIYIYIYTTFYLRLLQIQIKMLYTSDIKIKRNIFFFIFLKKRIHVLVAAGSTHSPFFINKTYAIKNKGEGLNTING